MISMIGNYMLFENRNQQLFHLSSLNLDNEILKPRIPNNYMTQNGYEDNVTKRVSFSTSIQGCLIGMSQNLKNKILNVHIPSDPIDTNHIINTKKLKDKVPDAHLTGEIWITIPIKIKYIYKIKILQTDNHFQYTFGPNKKATTYSWKYEILK